MHQVFTIGKLAAEADVNVETIRFYERRGLLAQPEKKLGGFRYYDDQAVARVRFIKRAQTLGFSLEEINDLMVLNKNDCCRQTHDAAVTKLAIVEARIEDLNRIRKTLKTLIKKCEAGGADLSCPIIETLGGL
jgi:MerR family mercuric resistance operon transcriptional regulator